MSCVVRWWDVLFVKGMHFSSKNARLLNFCSFHIPITNTVTISTIPKNGKSIDVVIGIQTQRS